MSPNIYSGIVQTDISDHFPIYFCQWRDCYELNHKKETLFEREINERSKEPFENILNNCSWDIVSNETNPDIV